MRYVPHLLCVVGFLAVAFGYWGINTVAGRRRFDEMAGMIPLAIGVGGAFAVVVGLVWFLVRLRS
jgi:hypothetical protein